MPGGLACRILSPGRSQSSKLRPKWLRAVQEADLDPAAPVAEEPLRPPGRLERMGAPDLLQLAAERTPEDNKEANGSSIAILATWAERTALLTGDAHSDVLLETLDRWLGPDGTLEVDLFKLPHHGSKANVTDALMKRVRAKCYVFSSSGQGRSQHPNDPAVARVIVKRPGTDSWPSTTSVNGPNCGRTPRFRRNGAIEPCYPAGSEGIVIDLLDL